MHGIRVFFNIKAVMAAAAISLFVVTLLLAVSRYITAADAGLLVSVAFGIALFPLFRYVQQGLVHVEHMNRGLLPADGDLGPERGLMTFRERVVALALWREDMLGDRVVDAARAATMLGVYIGLHEPVIAQQFLDDLFHSNTPDTQKSFQTMAQMSRYITHGEREVFKRPRQREEQR